jgi:hypothetical protein
VRQIITLIILLSCLFACGNSDTTGTTSSIVGTTGNTIAISQLVIGKIYHADGIDFSVQQYDPFIDSRKEPDVSSWENNHIFRLICKLHNTTTQSWRTLPVIWGGEAFLPPEQADTTTIDGGGIDSNILVLTPGETITRRLYYVYNSPETVARNLSINKTLANGNGRFPDPPSPPIALITIQAWCGNWGQGCAG